MGISVWQLLIILAIVVVLFGTKKLRNIGSDLGGAIKNFRGAVKEGEESKEESTTTTTSQHLESGKGTVIEGEAKREKDKA